jgi:hypothetical protein
MTKQTQSTAEPIFDVAHLAEIELYSPRVTARKTGDIAKRACAAQQAA